jgi:hypothetical protein
MKLLVWVGVGFNILASLINVFEKTNNGISKNLLKDINAIKDGTYVDEGTMVEMAPTQGAEGPQAKEPLLSENEK